MSAPLVCVNIEPGTGGRFNYVVTTSPTGYRAVMERCDRDGCESNGGYLQECRRALNEKKQHETGGSDSVNAWLKHVAKYCHGWHQGRIDDFAASVRRTYGSHRLAVTPGRIGVLLKGWPQRGPMSAEAVADALGLTVEQYRAQLALAGEL